MTMNAVNSHNKQGNRTEKEVQHVRQSAMFLGIFTGIFSYL